MSKEKILEEFDVEFECYFKGSAEFSDRLHPFLSQALAQTREETIREVKAEIVRYIKENEKKDNGGRVIGGEEIYNILNKLKK